MAQLDASDALADRTTLLERRGHLRDAAPLGDALRQNSDSFLALAQVKLGSCNTPPLRIRARQRAVDDLVRP
jgi:hypothetical protein